MANLKWTFLELFQWKKPLFRDFLRYGYFAANEPLSLSLPLPIFFFDFGDRFLLKNYIKTIVWEWETLYSHFLSSLSEKSRIIYELCPKQLLTLTYCLSIDFLTRNRLALSNLKNKGWISIKNLYSASRWRAALCLFAFFHETSMKSYQCVQFSKKMVQKWHVLT